jgi:NAD(P)-dependent dehydrogenase (short-subunit alcohol dehydrogenase family)
VDLHLAGKVAVVTGASKGIGLAVTQAFVAEGVRVAAGARTIGDDLEALTGDGTMLPVPGDLSSPEGPARLIDEAVRAFGAIDILVNNVGATTPRLDGFLAVGDEEWERTLSLNFLTAVRTTRAALPHLRERAPSTTGTVCSVNSFLPDPTVVDYSAAKAALANLSKSLSKEFGPRGVRINTVSPGPVGTALWLGDHGVAASLAAPGGRDPDAIAKEAVAGTATGRFTRPDEVADVVVMLAGGRAGNITGSDVVIDGGLVSTL